MIKYWFIFINDNNFAQKLKLTIQLDCEYLILVFLLIWVRFGEVLCCLKWKNRINKINKWSLRHLKDPIFQGTPSYVTKLSTMKLIPSNTLLTILSPTGQFRNEKPLPTHLLLFQDRKEAISDSQIECLSDSLPNIQIYFMGGLAIQLGRSPKVRDTVRYLLLNTNYVRNILTLTKIIN